MRRKLSAAGLSLTGLLSYSSAHTGEEMHHMMSGGMMHGGWIGGLFFLSVWVLVILGIIYLAQKIRKNTETGEES